MTRHKHLPWSVGALSVALTFYVWIANRGGDGEVAALPAEDATGDPVADAELEAPEERDAPAAAEPVAEVLVRDGETARVVVDLERGR